MEIKTEPEGYDMRLLLIEDDESLHRIIRRHLTEAGYATDGCKDGEEGLYYMESLQYDCVILDWMLPRRDGVSVLKEARKNGCTSPVLMLTARDSITDLVTGLDAGADDYLVKPFSFDELLARIRALLRRGTETKQIILELDGLKMDTSTHSVTRDEKTISLTSREYALLEYLLRNQGILQTRLQIADHVWNYDYDYDSNVVDVYIRYLRNKIDKGFDRTLIHTVRGFGYVMREEP